MQSVNLSGLNELDDMFNEILNDFPDKRRELHEDIKQMLKREVDSSISGSLNDNNGLVKSWQEARAGSGGGYAAISAKRNTFHNGYAVGYITNALENGHRIRPPRRQSKYYRSRVKQARVEGRSFYQKSVSNAISKAIDMTRQMVDELTNEMNR
ncbi:hypothetical protein [Eubacterium ventriosum]|uniref:hypothetical protein n=1 Tax=Eubacterium ventriosum TaxID=39496 RepID=UPI003522DC48